MSFGISTSHSPQDKSSCRFPFGKLPGGIFSWFDFPENISTEGGISGEITKPSEIHVSFKLK